MQTSSREGIAIDLAERSIAENHDPLRSAMTMIGTEQAARALKPKNIRLRARGRKLI
jgi:hypothetical protein